MLRGGLDDGDPNWLSLSLSLSCTVKCRSKTPCICERLYTWRHRKRMDVFPQLRLNIYLLRRRPICIPYQKCVSLAAQKMEIQAYAI